MNGRKLLIKALFLWALACVITYIAMTRPDCRARTVNGTCIAR
jgi:hypothetical protein